MNGKDPRNRLKGSELKKFGESKLWDAIDKKNHIPATRQMVECTCASWCLMDHYSRCCQGSECECKVRENKGE